MADLISVIVPIYNSAKYICDCVRSVLLQTYTYFELILIDDGSQDQGREICETMCITDKRIRLIAQKHKGVSAARNAGIKAAGGKYLFFMDVDDIIHPRLLESLYILLEQKGAAIATESRYYAGGGDFRKPDGWAAGSDSTQAGTYLDKKNAIRALIWGKRETTLYVIGGKMVASQSVDSVQFDEKLTHGEDTLFLYQLLEKGADVVALHNNWYYYRMYEGSTNKNFSVPACQSRYQVQQYILNHEIKSGRTANAIYWEKAIVEAMMAWYITGKKRKDENLIEYVTDLARCEKKRKIFSRLAWYEQLKFFLIFSCYPLYRLIYIVYIRIAKCPWFSRCFWRSSTDKR